MNLGQRIELIKKLSRTMAELGFEEIDLILEQGGIVPLAEWEGDEESYCRTLLGKATDETLVQLDNYLHGPSDASADDAPWRTDDLKLFVSHVSAHAGYASLLSSALASYGIEGFVAHEDIEPNKDWQRVIEAALRSCDACVALLHKGFPGSNWCDQEVGFVMCRNLPVVPVRFDLQPYGFLGKVQSLRAGSLDAFELAPEIVRSLLRDPRTGLALTDRLVYALVNAYNFNQANTISGMLATTAPSISISQLQAMREARENNLQVRGAYSVRANLRAIEKKFDLVDLAAVARRQVRERSGFNPV